MKATRQVFTLPSYTMVNGRTLKDVHVGFETYGTLNPARDNAILVCHYFSGSAHAAGRYEESDPLPGWWDEAIGPGKAIDTDKYFVICSDTLCCVKPFDGHVVTTGPASVNPETGQRYGIDFPIPHMADIVHVQKALLDHLGIAQLVAVAGPSAGSMQAIQWAVEYPAMVPRVLAVISPGLHTGAYPRCIADSWIAPILADGDWQGGRYEPSKPPLRGLTEATRVIFITAVSPAFIADTFGDRWADPARDPLAGLNNQYLAQAAIGAQAAASGAITDANHLIYMAKTCCSYDVRSRIGEARARFLFLPAESDLIFLPSMSEEAVAQIRAAGGEAEIRLLAGNGGHLDGLSRITQAREQIAEFLARP